MIQALLQEKAEGLKQIKDRAVNNVGFKAAGTMLSTTNVTGNTTMLPPPTVSFIQNPPINEVSTIFAKLPKILISTPTLVLADQVDGTESASSTTQGNAKTQVDFSVTASSSIPMRKLTGYVKVSRELVDDIPFMDYQITQFLRKKLTDAITDYILTELAGMSPTTTVGSLTSGSTLSYDLHILPIVTEQMKQLTGYNMDTWIGGIDVVSKMYGQCVNNHPAPGIDYWISKGQTDLFSSHQSSGYLTGIDSMMFPVYIYKDIEVSVGYENDDFTKNLATIRGECRISFPTSGVNQLLACITDSPANFITALS